MRFEPPTKTLSQILVKFIGIEGSRRDYSKKRAKGERLLTPKGSFDTYSFNDEGLTILFVDLSTFLNQ